MFIYSLAFVTRENILRTPAPNRSNQFTKPATPTSGDLSSSSLDFDLLENEVPPTPYREMGLMTPVVMGTRGRRSGNEADNVIPLILKDDSF